MDKFAMVSRVLSRQILISGLVGIVLGGLLGVYFAYVAALGEAGDITANDRLQVGLSVANLIIVSVLAGITGWYAQSTKDIARATSHQSEAMTAQSDVLSRQLVQGVRPIIRFTSEFLTELDGSRVVIRNIGVGPALNVKCWIVMNQSDRSRATHNNDGNQHQFRTSALEVGGIAGERASTDWQLNIIPKPSDNLQCTFYAAYEDIYGNGFVSEAAYMPVDQPEGRHLRLDRFSTKQLGKNEVRRLLQSSGYDDPVLH